MTIFFSKKNLGKLRWLAFTGKVGQRSSTVVQRTRIELKDGSTCFLAVQIFVAGPGATPCLRWAGTGWPTSPLLRQGFIWSKNLGKQDWIVCNIRWPKGKRASYSILTNFFQWAYLNNACSPQKCVVNTVSTHWVSLGQLHIIECKLEDMHALTEWCNFIDRIQTRKFAGSTDSSSPKCCTS